MPGACAGIHVLRAQDSELKTWMAGTSPAMTQIVRRDQSAFSSASPPETSTLPGASSTLRTFTAPLSTSMA